MMRIALPLIAITVLVSLSFLIDGQSSHRTTMVSHTPNHSTDQVFAPGRVEGMSLEVGLLPELHGPVAEVLIDEGQLVAKDQVLLRLEDDQYQHELALATANVELAEAEKERLENGARQQERQEAEALYQGKLARLTQAQRALKRVERLHADGAATRQELDDQRAQVKSLSAETRAVHARLGLLTAAPRPDEVRIAISRIAAANARRHLAKDKLERTRLRAPFDGQILTINVNAGELTGPKSNQPAIVIADVSEYRIRAFVDEMDAPRVEVGMQATVVADGLPGQQFSGRVTRLSPRMTRKQLWTNDPHERHDTKTREVWIQLQDKADFVIGLRVDVVITPASKEPQKT